MKQLCDLFQLISNQLRFVEVLSSINGNFGGLWQIDERNGQHSLAPEFNVLFKFVYYGCVDDDHGMSNRFIDFFRKDILFSINLLTFFATINLTVIALTLNAKKKQLFNF